MSLVRLLCLIFGLGTGLGAIYPKFKHENIASVSMSLGGMAFMLIAFSIVIATLSLEAWIFYVYFLKEVTGTSEKMQIVSSIAGVILINAGAFYFPMKIGEKKLQEYTGII